MAYLSSPSSLFLGSKFTAEVAEKEEKNKLEKPY